MTNKPIKDLTPEERDAFLQEVREKLRPDEWEKLVHGWGAVVRFFSILGEVQKEFSAGAETSQAFFEIIGEFFLAFFEEAEQDKSLDDMSTEDVFKNSDIIERILARLEAKAKTASGTKKASKSPLSLEYFPLFNGTPTNDIMQITTKGVEADTFTKSATITTPSGHKITISRFDELQGSLGTSAKKILYTALAFLADCNFYRSDRGNINPTVEIPLIEYGEACGYLLTPRKMETESEQDAEKRRVDERIKYLKKNIRRDLHILSETRWMGEETKGRKKGDYTEIRPISGHSIRNGIIRINFDIDAAYFLANSYIMPFPRALLKHDNEKPNPFAIGYKIALHNENDQNRAAGTENTLSVKSLLSSAPEIPTIDELKARGQRNWKDKIKKPLETSLDENVRVGYLIRWEYRDPKDNTTYNSTTSQSLTWAQYFRLKVDFVVKDAPEQTERRKTRAEEKAKAAADKGQERKKRGRPRKIAES